MIVIDCCGAEIDTRTAAFVRSRLADANHVQMHPVQLKAWLRNTMNVDMVNEAQWKQMFQEMLPFTVRSLGGLPIIEDERMAKDQIQFRDWKEKIIAVIKNLRVPSEEAQQASGAVRTPGEGEEPLR